MTLAIDSAVPDFKALSTQGEFDSSRMRGKKLVLFFYPKDNTPGCTTESEAFRDLHDRFTAASCIVAGVSRDSLKSHHNFKEKLQAPFELISDEDETLCSLFGVIKMKTMYGKTVRGIERSTFLIDTHGILRREWRGVKVPGHVDDVLNAVETMA